MTGSMPVILKVWSADFDFKKEVLQTIPIWAKLPNLPLSCWGMDSLSRIGSALGIPFYVDACTTQVDRVSYARILVEMDITRKVPNLIKALDPNYRLLEQRVGYDWAPKYFPTCLTIGHVWKPKTQKPKAPMKKQVQAWVAQRGENNIQKVDPVG